MKLQVRISPEELKKLKVRSPPEEYGKKIESQKLA